jgi:hypothetical protein
MAGERAQALLKTIDTTATALNAKVTACNTGAAVVTSCALPTGAATAAAQTDGTQKAIMRGAAKGTTAAADATAPSVDADHTAVDVTLATLLSGEDQDTDSLCVIDYIHREIHEGEHFFVALISTELDTTSYYWKITTPDSDTHIHFTLELSCNVACNGFLYENPTVNVAGTAATEFNSDRNSAAVATAAVTYGDTSTADGTLLWSNTFGGSGGPAKTSGNVGTREEIILKRNEEYFVKVTTLANDGFVNCRMIWY